LTVGLIVSRIQQIFAVLGGIFQAAGDGCC
jgi:hypothetical protein